MPTLAAPVARSDRRASSTPVERAAAPRLELPPFHDALPAPVWFRAVEIPSEATYPHHRHAWGEFVYAYSGVIEVALADHRFVAPPQYGIWLPPGLAHRGLNRAEVVHASVYVAAERCGGLPRAACALTVTPLLRTLLDHLRAHRLAAPLEAPQARLLDVVVDQLEACGCAGSYLPGSADPILGPILRALQDDPHDDRTLAELAAAWHTTERTLLRRCQRDLGMSFSQWRQRLRVTQAMPMLEAGRTVEAIALGLGYDSASAFIAMFRRMTGTTPDEFRRQATRA